MLMTERTEISTVYKRMKRSIGKLNGSYVHINCKLNWFHTRITVLHYQHMSGILKNKDSICNTHDRYTMGSHILHTVMIDTQWAVTYYTHSHDRYTMGSHILHTQSWSIHNGQLHITHTVMIDTQWAVTYYTHSHDWYTWAVTYYTHSHDRNTMCSHTYYTQSKKKNLKQSWLPAFWNKIKTHKRFKRMLILIRQYQKMHTFSAKTTFFQATSIQIISLVFSYNCNSFKHFS